jgi:ELWxxDGT repeat protein
LTAVGNTLYFEGRDNIHGRELWKSDGTAEGTILVKDIVPGIGESRPGNYPGYFLASGTIIYFGAIDSTYGLELWRSDGTESGTLLVKDINPGRADSHIWWATIVGDSLYFSVNDGTHGVELWKSNGTESSTMMVKDINPGSANSMPSWLLPILNAPQQN